jgi:molecular chaperone GrpE
MSKSREERSQDTANVADASPSGESENQENLVEEGEEDSENDGTIRIETQDTDEGAEEADGEVIEGLAAKVASLEEQLLRKQADFENFRKRMFREREEAAKHANAKLLLDLVEIIDNFERAINSSEESRDFDSLHEGIELIEKQFASMLENKWGLTRFDSSGMEFDPERHEAIAVDQSGEFPPQTVVEDYQKGYLLHDRVLRHARVKVAMPNQDEASSEPGGTDKTE